ncbi:MAG: RNA polymerase subunit sigma-70 [Anaerolinea sp.]|nr:RNA polymerase subunit sigma-70 [Anaerolinea sp.]
MLERRTVELRIPRHGPGGCGLANQSVDTLAPEFDERAVVTAAQRGEQQALSDLYEYYFPKVYRYVNARLATSEDAEDVTTEVFLRIIDNLGSFSFRGLPFGAWVFRIARNEVVSFVRRQKVRGVTAELHEAIPDTSADYALEIETQFTIAVVREATGKLPEAQRQVITLRFGAGLTVAETARALNKTENNVKVLQHKAIAKLQTLVPRD